MTIDTVLKRPDRWARVMSWATLAGVEFGMIGPFGSYASNIFTRTAYWTGLFWVGSVVLWPSTVSALRHGPRHGFPPLFSMAAIVLLACVPLAMAGAVATYLCWPNRAAGMRPLEWYWLTLSVALPAMAGLVWLELGRTDLLRLRPGPMAKEAEAQNPLPPSTPLPAHILDSALCLQMEDHYVRVHGDHHSHMHFAVMRDVIAALGNGRGLQVHRSWWVARDAVKYWSREGRSVQLTLNNGLCVPVARNRVAILRAEGWLDASSEVLAGRKDPEAPRLSA